MFNENERWSVGDKVIMIETNDRLGEIVGFPKIHNAAMAWVVWHGNKRKMSCPLVLLEKAQE